ncbi:MAG: hypothetical protein KBT12_03855 [Bacteroidales bacterium]|nr:hypothetical protein [Candidatus Physcousia equi]
MDSLPTAHEVDGAQFVDTLREVTVRPDSGGIRLPVSNAIRESLKLQGWAQQNSLNGILQRHAPMLHDQIMHPFAFKERKRIRKKKKVDHVLQQYDAVAADPLQALLDSVKRALLQEK